ncbi:MAG TPA: hypothetical protein VHM24_03480 [Gemmatimonadaceae bacterium]|nr:hypothetical protein [Gemmatimonadaceae bacterium]
MRRRSGFALAAALLAIVLIAVLVTGALFATNQEATATSAAILEQQARSYAERAAVMAAADWSCGECDALPIGSVIVRVPTTNPPFESTVYLTRLDSALYLVTAEGRVVSRESVRSRRRVSLIVRTARDTGGITRASRVTEQAWSAVYQM